MSALTKPPKGDIWIHVDQLQREDGRVWAIQYWVGNAPHYHCVRAIIVHAMMFTQFHGPKAKQPKAVLVIPKGTVRICEDFAYVS